MGDMSKRSDMDDKGNRDDWAMGYRGLLLLPEVENGIAHWANLKRYLRI